MSNEREQLAAIGSVIGTLDATLDGLFRTVAELKDCLGLPAEVTVTAPVPAPQGALETAQALQHALEAMSADLQTVSKRLGSTEKTARRLKHIVIALAVSLCLDLLITAGFGWNTVRVNQSENASHADQITACDQGNVARRQDAAVWHTFLGDIAPPKVQTPKVKALLAGIDRRIAEKDARRNCASLYRIGS